MPRARVCIDSAGCFSRRCLSAWSFEPPPDQKNHIDGTDGDLRAMSIWACKLRDSGDSDGNAVLMLRDVLDGRRKLNGSRHVDTIYAMINLSQALQDEGDLQEAEHLAREAMDVSRIVLGSWHPDTLSAEGHLSVILTIQGQLTEAEVLAEQVTSRSREVLGDCHPATLVALGNLAQTLAAVGKRNRAEALMREELQLSIKVHGVIASDTLVSLTNMTSLLLSDERLDDAVPFLRRQVYTTRALHGESQQTLHSLGCLSRALLRLDRMAEAEQVLREEAHVSKILHGEDNSETIAVLGRLGEALEAQQKHVLALPFVRAAFGERHPRTLAALQNCCVLLQKDGQYEAAELLARELSQISSELLGTDHPFTLIAHSNLMQLKKAPQGFLSDMQR